MTAGEITEPIGTRTSTVECSEINGRTECRRRTSTCTDTFGSGGCDISDKDPPPRPSTMANGNKFSKLRQELSSYNPRVNPPSSMGGFSNQLVSHSSDPSANRIVPFSQPQASMGMRPRPRLTTTTTTRRPRITTRRTTLLELATTTTAPDLRERIAQEVVDMDAHGLAEAIHDPMMMGLAAIVISAGMSLLDNATNLYVLGE